MTGRAGTAAHTKSWEPADDAALARLVAEGHSGSEIGHRLGRSRNAVLGRIHRLKHNGLLPPDALARLMSRPATPAKAPQPARLPGSRAAGAQIARAREARRGDTEPRGAVSDRLQKQAFDEGFRGQTGRVNFLDLRLVHCRWPIVQASGETRYCGADATTGSWCAMHAKWAVAGARP